MDRALTLKKARGARGAPPQASRYEFMQKTAQLRLMAAKALRLSRGVGDDVTVTMLKAYSLECTLDADVREADIDNAAWKKPAA